MTPKKFWILENFFLLHRVLILVLSLNVPQARTELFKKAFMFAAPSTWNDLQKTIKLQCLIPLNYFKGYIKTIEHRVHPHVQMF